MLTSLRAVWLAALLLAAAADPIAKLMPEDGIPPGWQRRGQVRLFAGAALYQHINGGAEMYHQSGFDCLAVQDYAKDALEARVEIYRMNDRSGAAAVFAEITSGLAVQADFGAASVLDSFQIMFRRGVFCVSVTTYESGPEVQAAMAAIASKVDAAIVSLFP